MKQILKCTCGTYTLKEQCTRCGNKAISPLPPKYSPADKFADYRRKAKLQLYKDRGLV